MRFAKRRITLTPAKNLVAMAKRSQSMFNMRNTPLLTEEEMLRQREILEQMRKTEPLPRRVNSPSTRRKARKSAESLLREAATVQRNNDTQVALLDLVEDFSQKKIIKDPAIFRSLLEKDYEVHLSLVDVLKERMQEKSLKPLVNWIYNQSLSVWTEDAWQFVIRHKRRVEFAKVSLNYDRRFAIETKTYLREDGFGRCLLRRWLDTAKRPPLSSGRDTHFLGKAEHILIQCLQHILTITGDLLEILQYTGRGVVQRLFLTCLFHLYYAPMISELENVKLSKFIIGWLSTTSNGEENKVYDYFVNSEQIQDTLHSVHRHLRYRR